jgi:AraC-like DNA-binding protein
MREARSSEPSEAMSERSAQRGEALEAERSRSGSKRSAQRGEVLGAERSRRDSARIVEHALAGSTLRVAERPLTPRCAAYARSRYGYEEHAAGEVARSEFANASVVVILEIAEPLRVGELGRDAQYAGGFVAGIHDGPTRTAHDGHQAGVQLDLSPLAARLVLGVPLAELAHRVVAAADALPRAYRALPARLAELDSWDARLDAVDELLASAAGAKLPAGFRELAWAVAQIEQRAGGVRVAALARELGWSERRLERAFAEQIGVSPKVFARLARFDALMASVRRGAHTTWAETAHAFGFADQSHLVRDVRQFSGVPPSTASLHLLPQQPIA